MISLTQTSRPASPRDSQPRRSQTEHIYKQLSSPYLVIDPRRVRSPNLREAVSMTWSFTGVKIAPLRYDPSISSSPYNEAVMAGGDDAGSPALLSVQPEWAHWFSAPPAPGAAAVQQHAAHRHPSPQNASTWRPVTLPRSSVNGLI